MPRSLKAYAVCGGHFLALKFHQTKKKQNHTFPLTGYTFVVRHVSRNALQTLEIIIVSTLMETIKSKM